LRINLNWMPVTTALILLTAALAAPSPLRCEGYERVERSAFVMGTVLRLEVVGATRACALAAAEAALAEVERLEAVLSSWRDDSELGRLNASSPAGPVAAAPELRALLAEAAGWREATGGAFDPAIGALVDVWDFRGSGRVPSAAELAGALPATGLAACYDVRAGRRIRESCWLDSGGFGKGAALRAAGLVLRAHGVAQATLDLGGQLQVLGAAAPVAVAHPAERARAVRALRVVDASVATSAQSERFIELDGVRYGHVLDPRTGLPVPAWGSVTVVAADALAADALSTALFVMGPEAALAWARSRADIGVLVLELRDGDVVASWNPALESLLVPLTATEPTSKETF
jgi:thiamine biosynthesis lipoprotein